MQEAIEREFLTAIDPKAWLDADHEITEAGLRDRIAQAVEEAYEAKVAAVGAPVMRHLEKAVMLQELDRHWREHLAAMDYLRQGIHLRAYAQKNPKQEYKREAFELFGALLDRIKHDTVVAVVAAAGAQRSGDRGAGARARAANGARSCRLQHASPQSVILQPTAARGTCSPHRADGGFAAGPGFARRVRRRAAVCGPPPVSAGEQPSCVKAARSGATSRARAGRARSTSTVTGSFE